MRKYLPLAVFAAVTAASLFTAAVAYFSAEEAAQIKFEATADDALARIEARLELHRSLLLSTHAFIEAQAGSVGREAFKAFVDDLRIETRYSGVFGIGFARLVEADRASAAETELARNYQVEQSVWPERTGQALRAPIVLLEPVDDQNRTALGFDMFSEPARREAMIRAMETGEPSASAIVDLVQNDSGARMPGFLLYLPLRNKAEMGPDGKPRAGGADGFVFAPFRAGALFNAALGRLPVLPLNIEIHDGDEPTPETLLFRSDTPAEEAWLGRVSTRRVIAFAGRNWLVSFRPSAGFEAPSSRLLPVMLGLLGLLLAAAIATVARFQERAYDAATRLQKTTESSLLEKDLMLQEMKHRIKNSITRVLAIARQTAASSDGLTDFSESFGARLQAMAASQDMLTRSRWQKADLAELLATELEQVFGKDLDRQSLKGPRVELNEATTQALGLTFHELATNALKYGDAADATGALTVEWRVKGARSNRRLLLIWTEMTGKPVTRPEKTGFGTKLIDMNIVRELGGSIERDYRADGIKIEILVPLRQ